MASSLAIVVILVLALSGSFAEADVSHLGYNRYTRPSTTRLQRLESNPTPYPAAGYRPNREFGLPRERPVFPADTNPHFFDNSQGGSAVLSQPQTPRNTYGAPARLRQATPARLQQQVYRAPQQTYAAPQQDNVAHPSFQGQNQNSNGFDNFSELGQRPNGLYQTPSRNPQQEDFEQPQAGNSAGFDNLGETQQRPNILYAAPSRLRQAPARLQQFPRMFTSSQSGRLTTVVSGQSSRLTDNREDEEDEEDTINPNADIETVNKKEETKKATDQPQAVATVAYYPAGAFSFVQPVNGAYVASAAPTAAFVAAPKAAALLAAPKAFLPTTPSAAFVATPTFVQQPYTLAPITSGVPLQLRAW